MIVKRPQIVAAQEPKLPWAIFNHFNSSLLSTSALTLTSQLLVPDIHPSEDSNSRGCYPPLPPL